MSLKNTIRIMKLTYYGHSTFGIEANGVSLLFDPFISPNGAASSINIEEIPADHILISHGHQDHIYDAEAIAKRTGAEIISNFEIVTWYGSKGIKGNPMNHGGKVYYDWGSVKYVNAIHTSSFPDGSYAGQPGGFVVELVDKCFYFSGDTALTMDMKLIPMLCPKLNFAILPIGDRFTMGVEEAIIASDFIECDTIVACHYDTFDLIKIDQAAAVKAFAEKGKELKLLNIGTSIGI